MKYLFLAYTNEADEADEAPWDTRPGDERTAYEMACATHIQILRENGHLVAGAQLQNKTAVTVQVQDGTVSLTDGPGGQASAQLIGFYLINARDLNDAIRIASTLPHARQGLIDVWPLTSQDP